ncbi:MAG: hypothetical protein Q7J19_07605 [Lutibacter sp.]|nr:hypothetical protein [Lutibacter sp.]
MGNPGGGGGALESSGLGGLGSEYAATPMSIKLKHSMNTLTFFLFILGLNMLQT